MCGPCLGLSQTHFLFLATNCWFVRRGVEAFVGARVATLALRSCSESSRPWFAPSVARCARQPWFALLNRPHVTFSRQTVEGQFYPASMMVRPCAANSYHPLLYIYLVSMIVSILLLTL